MYLSAVIEMEREPHFLQLWLKKGQKWNKKMGLLNKLKNTCLKLYDCHYMMQDSAPEVLCHDVTNALKAATFNTVWSFCTKTNYQQQHRASTGQTRTRETREDRQCEVDDVKWWSQSTISQLEDFLLGISAALFCFPVKYNLDNHFSELRYR